MHTKIFEHFGISENSLRDSADSLFFLNGYTRVKLLDMSLMINMYRHSPKDAVPISSRSAQMTSGFFEFCELERFADLKGLRHIFAFGHI